MNPARVFAFLRRWRDRRRREAVAWREAAIARQEEWERAALARFLIKYGHPASPDGEPL